MKLYREVLIESIEQAEALPIGTVAKKEATTVVGGTWYAPPRVSIGRGTWTGDDLYRSADMVGWTALVPMEAEEETRVGVDRAEQGLWSMALEASAYGERVSLDGIRMAHRFKTAWMPRDETS